MHEHCRNSDFLRDETEKVVWPEIVTDTENSSTWSLAAVAEASSDENRVPRTTVNVQAHRSACKARQRPYRDYLRTCKAYWCSDTIDLQRTSVKSSAKGLQSYMKTCRACRRAYKRRQRIRRSFNTGKLTAATPTPTERKVPKKNNMLRRTPSKTRKANSCNLQKKWTKQPVLISTEWNKLSIRAASRFSEIGRHLIPW